MEEIRRPTPNSFTRPSARVGASVSPVQRANYGIPPRQSQIQNPQSVSPTGPRTMDIRPPRPAQPVQIAPPTITPVQPVSTPVFEQPQQPLATPPSTEPLQPLFTPTPRPIVTSATKQKRRGILPKVGLVLLILSVLLIAIGAVRWVTAGSTEGHKITVGAVAANDDTTMTIQFTADDGKMHKFTTESIVSMIPGTAREIAYRSGAPEASAKQVALIKDNRSLGITITSIGVTLLLLTGLAFLVAKSRTGHKIS